MEEAKVKGPMIIAMKGHPCTGKSTLGWAIAKVLKCPILDIDAIRDGMRTAQESPLAAAAKTFEDLCYDSLCTIALAQLRLELTIIIDSPLSRRCHLDRLQQLAVSTGAPLVIIECKPQDVYEWENWLYQSSSRSWYKPTTWDEVEPLLKVLYEDYEIEGITKLVVDTTTYVRDVDLCHAIDYLAAQQPYLPSVNFTDWTGDGFGTIFEADPNRTNDEQDTQRRVHIHDLVVSHSEEGGEKLYNDEVRCEGCLEVILDSIYYRCLSIHKLCAELPGKQELLPEDYPDFIKSLPKQYAFPEQHRCSLHYDGLFECSRCLFETNLSKGLVPSVIDHKCHDHPLNIMLHPLSSNNMFLCQACGDLGHHALYNCSTCKFECHVDCALLPHRSKQLHHRHTLDISPPPPPPQDNDSSFEVCDACEEDRNPKNWGYSCQESHDCNGFVCHLKCMTFQG
ncbi:Nucleoredoxin 1-2 like [Actinidia chinensis var. chinensis]|uniref:Nucleoredoxin 1-2 like n=1 Tax=Actinidia chinensis var. chinensis TaxID=1590841 RepID=A0A2R6P8J0_ACTCC|nr:Nucleoredoxin 1-2 like [Actinidia chinensis var. chinensis]